jgi:hypothetical protein
MKYILFLFIFIPFSIHAQDGKTSQIEPLKLKNIKRQIDNLTIKKVEDQIKKTILELNFERIIFYQKNREFKSAQELYNDIKNNLNQTSKFFLQLNNQAKHTSINKAIKTTKNNPYLIAMEKRVLKDLLKPDIEWPIATLKNPTFTGLNRPRHIRDTGKLIREYFWLFAHKNSPLRYNPEILKRLLRRAHAYIDGYALLDKKTAFKHVLYDQFAVEEAFAALYEIAELYPNFLLPSQKNMWDKTLEQAASTLWERMKNAKAWNLNIETARMVGLLNLGYYTDNKDMVDKVISHVDTIISKMRPDGAWPYHGEGNPSVNYHNNLTMSLLRIYDQTSYTPILDALKSSQWKGPVMGRTDEFWTSPFYKTYRWNYEKGTETGPEAVATLSKNGYVRWLLDRNMKVDREQVTWYDASIKPTPLPINYTIPDRNVGGPRAWYGNFNYAGTFFNPPIKMEGHETLMGAMTVDTTDGRLNSVLTNITPKIWMFPKDQIDKNSRRVNSAWGKLTKNLLGATTITQNYSISTAIHDITAVHLHAYQGAASQWQARQVWVGLPDRLIGSISIVPHKDGAKAYAIHSVLRFISGGTAGAKETKKLLQIDNSSYQYGQLQIIIHHSNYKSLTPILKKYRRKEYPATELTFSNRQLEPAPPASNIQSFSSKTKFEFIVEIRPSWTKSNCSIDSHYSKNLLQLNVNTNKRKFQLWINASKKNQSIPLNLKLIKGQNVSYVQSSGLLKKSLFTNKIPHFIHLKEGQHAFIITSDNITDHTNGWQSFSDMINSKNKSLMNPTGIPYDSPFLKKKTTSEF